MTVFLAQIWGPGILAIGLGFFVSRAHYARVYKNLDKESLAVLVFAMAAIAAGIVQVSVHNVWNTIPEVVISFLGWGLLAKGVGFAVMPRISDRLGDWTANRKLIPTIGVLLLVIGAYVSWVGYFA